MRSKRLLLLLLAIIFSLIAPTFTIVEAAPIQILPTINRYSLDGSNYPYIPYTLNMIGQNIWAAYYVYPTNPYYPQTLLYQWDSNAQKTGSGVTIVHPILNITSNGQNFFGETAELIWEFTPAGDDVAHYILPKELIYPVTGTSSFVSIAWDGSTPGGPYLWFLKSDGALYQARLSDPLVVVNTFSLSALDEGSASFFRGLATDGQNIWVIAHSKNTLNEYFWKINPSNGSLIHSYSTLIPENYYLLNLTIDNISQGGPYLYTIGNFFNNGPETFDLFKLSTYEQTWQVLFMPAFPHSFTVPTPYPTPTPY